MTPPTPYPDVNAVLHLLLTEARTVLGSHFRGMYLYGSLASGDFDPNASDIDFVIATDDELSDKLIAELAAMHARIRDSGLKWAPRLEGSYLPQHALRRYNPNDPPRPTLNEGKFYVAPHGSDWVIQRHVLRQHGVALAGPPPQTLIDPVQPDELRRAVQEILRAWWEPMLHDPSRLHRPDYQAYALLTMCRALYALKHGEIVSKPVAARWAQEIFGERWAGLIERALTSRHDVPMDGFEGTLDLIRYTLERSQQLEPGQV